MILSVHGGVRYSPFKSGPDTVNCLRNCMDSQSGPGSISGGRGVMRKFKIRRRRSSCVGLMINNNVRNGCSNSV